MPRHSDVIHNGLAEPFQRNLTRSVLGTDSAAQVESIMASLMAVSLGCNQPECFLFEMSVGATFGVRYGVRYGGLDNSGRRCLLKVFLPGSDVDELQRQARFQAWLSAHSFPCPLMLHEPAVHESHIYVIEGYLDLGDRADGHRSLDRKLLASELARLIDLGKHYPHQNELPLHALQGLSYGPWPQPHNVLFDFEATRQGAEWIDAIGSRYKPILDSCNEALVIGHMDWGAKHCRINNGEVSAIYDWASVARMPESRIVGQAAATFTTSWYVEGPNRPDLVEVKAFVAEYQTARGRTFSLSELKTLVAAIYFGAAYGARCEHANAHKNPSIENRDFLRNLTNCDLLSEIIGSERHEP